MHSLLIPYTCLLKNLKSKRVGVHGFRVQRFNVSFLVKHDGINESQRNSQSNYSAVLRMNQPVVAGNFFFNPKSQPKIEVDVSTVEIYIELRTSEP